MGKPILNDEELTRIREEVVFNATEDTISLINRLFSNDYNFRDELVKEIVDVFDIVFFALTPEEKRTRLNEDLPAAIEHAFLSFVAKNDGKIKGIKSRIEDSYINILDVGFAAVAEEVNRGCMIPAVAIAADAKSDKGIRTTIEYGSNHKITIPCQGMFISTDCIDAIKKSVARFDDENSDDSPSFSGFSETENKIINDLVKS